MTSERPGKRDRLVTGARETIHRQGVEGTTIADIAEASDVPVGNVYYYFKSKDELVAAAIDSYAQESRERLSWLERPSPDRVEGLPRRWRARGRTCSPRPAAHPVATARSRDGHEDQPGRSGPCLKHRGEVSPPKGPEAAPIY